MTWEIIAAISQLAGSIAVVIALLYAWLQIRAIRQEMLLSAMWEIFRELDSDETRSARRFVYRNRTKYKVLTDSDPEKFAQLPDEVRNNAYRVSNTLDRIGYVVHQGLIPPKLLLDGYHPIIARCWLVLEPFVYCVRAIRKQENYQQYFEYLASESFAHYISREEANSQIYETDLPSPAL